MHFRSLEEELPSLESVSSENSQESDKSDDLYRIRKLETIIAELTPSDTTAATTAKPIRTCANTETQTMSTGDIIMTSVYSEWHKNKLFSVTIKVFYVFWQFERCWEHGNSVN